MAGVVAFGIDRLLHELPSGLRRARFALLLNQASRNSAWQLACDALAARYPGQLKALMSPQHGLWGVEQANMVESSNDYYEPLGLPVYSLYGKTRRPTAEMLAGIDVLLVDLQDVGTRVYTFAWSVLECLRAAAECNVHVVVLDRPNPLGGVVAEGPMLQPQWTSFVGGWPIPMRHGLTLGELSQLLVRETRLDVELTVVPMHGWRRRMLWPEVGRPWFWPSPNLPTWDCCVLYPGMVLFEGTNVSEGRGTTRPFHVVGAPWLDGRQWLESLPARVCEGVVGLPTRFKPTFDKWAGDVCGGVDWYVVDPTAIRSVRLAVSLLLAAQRLAEGRFAWLEPPYEYEYEKLPIDILFGSPRLRMAADAGQTPTEELIEALLEFDRDAWYGRCESVLLYQ